MRFAEHAADGARWENGEWVVKPPVIGDRVVPCWMAGQGVGACWEPEA